IAGDAVATRELATQSGVLFAETLEEFADLIRISLLMRARRAGGMRVGAMSNAGFETVGMADNLGAFTLAPLSDATRATIVDVIRESRLEKIVTVTNPLDVNPMLNDTAFARVAEELIADENVDAAVIGCVPLSGALRTLAHELDTDEPTMVNVLTSLWQKTSKPWVCVIDGGPLYDELARRLHAGGVPVFRSADRAVRALSRWCSVSP
ncbi:MAG: CoA-binding protein, partial [Thermoanaerobaculia bacterium]